MAYVKQNFVKGQILTAEHMNHIENGIVAAADAQSLGGKAPEYYLQPRNLLDNSYFRNPVNQRGATSYSGNVYTIDRWRLNANTLNVGSDGITLVAGDSSSAVLTQYTSGLRDGVYTQALNVNGTIYTRMIQLSGSTITTLDASNAAYTGGYVSCTVSGSGYFSFQIRANAGYSITVRWAALYEGSYTADTLPPYFPKGYAAELAECQRYARIRNVDNYEIAILGAEKVFAIEHPGMRIGPTVQVINPLTNAVGNIASYSSGGEFQAVIMAITKDRTIIKVESGTPGNTYIYAYNINADM